MRPVLLSLIATACLLIATAPAVGGLQDVVQNPVSADFFVSPRGKDTWSGQAGRPGRERRAVRDGGARP